MMPPSLLNQKLDTKRIPAISQKIKTVRVSHLDIQDDRFETIFIGKQCFLNTIYQIGFDLWKWSI